MLIGKLKTKLPIGLFILLSPLVLIFNILLVLLMLLEPRRRKFDKAEARTLLSDELQKLKKVGYRKLKQKYIEQKDSIPYKVVGPSGTEYQVDIQGWWDDEPNGSIRILGGIDDGGLSAYSPLSESFIISKDDNFIDE